MSNIVNNNSKLESLIAIMASKGKLKPVLSLNDKTGDVVTEFADLSAQSELWTFVLSDNTKIYKTVLLYETP